jgi:hypothetical protein
MAILLPGTEILVSYDEVNDIETFAPAFTYGANIVDNGAPYQGAYISTDGELIQLGGMIRTTEPLAIGAVLLKLSSVLAPTANEMVKIEVNGTSLSAEVDVNGTITTKAAIGDNGTISLNSIKFLNKEVFVVDEEPPVEPEPVYYATTLSGKVSVTPVANQITSLYVPFDIPFEVAPNVVATANTTVPGTTVQAVSVGGVTTTGFTVYLLRTNTTATSVFFVATVENV